MSDVSPSNKPTKVRPLRAAEREVVKRMMRGRSIKAEIEATLSSGLVEDMHDGDMGSIRFVAPGSQSRRFAEAIAEAEYTDEDGVLVSIALNLDTEGDLYELDLWKVDFSPLKRHPKPSEIRVKEIA